MELEYADREKDRVAKKDLAALQLANKKEIRDSEINIQPTYSDRFFGIIYGKRQKKFGFMLSHKSESLLMSPVSMCKFAIAGLFAYTYCNIWWFNATNPRVNVKSLLPDPDIDKLSVLWFHSETVTNVISNLTLGGLAATTMAQPALMLVSYVVTNLTYKQLGSR
jgi:hypothetical protein